MTGKRSLFLFTCLAAVMSMGSFGGQALARYAVPPATLEVPAMDEFKVVPIPHLGRSGMMAETGRQQDMAGPVIPSAEPRQALPGSRESGFRQPSPGKTAQSSRVTPAARPDAAETGKHPPSAETILRGSAPPVKAPGKLQGPSLGIEPLPPRETQEPREPQELQVRRYAIPPVAPGTPGTGVARQAVAPAAKISPADRIVQGNIAPARDRRPTSFAMVNRDNARLRDAPSLNGQRLAVLQKGDMGRVLERRDGWSRLYLSARGATGWVRDDLLAIP